jgi:hypothetical protein
MTASSQRGTFSQAELAGDPGDNPRYHSVCGAGWEVVGPASLTVNSAQSGVGCVLGPGKQTRCVI